VRRDFDESKFWELQLEDIFLCMHLLDRLAFAKLNKNGRAIFVNVIVETIADELFWLCPTYPDFDDFRVWFGSSFNLRTMEYNKFARLFAEEDEQLNGTLLWEFGKRMCSVLSDYNPATTISITVHGTHLLKLMMEIFTADNLPTHGDRL
jgi:hypothetical protein